MEKHSHTVKKNLTKKRFKGKDNFDVNERDLKALKLHKKHNNRLKYDEEVTSDDEEFPLEKTKDVQNDLEEDKKTPEEIRVSVAKRFLKHLKDTLPETVTEHFQKNSQHQTQRYLSDKVSITFSEFLKGHKDTVTCVDVSPHDPNKVFTGSKDCSLIHWDVETKKKIRFLGRRHHFSCGGHFEKVLDLAVGCDAQTILSVGADHVVRVWDARVPLCVSTLYGHGKAVRGVCFDPNTSDARRFYTIGEDKSLKMWNLELSSCEETFFGHTALPCCIDILDKGRPVTGGMDATVRVWKVATDSHLLFNTEMETVDSVVQLNSHRTLSGHQNGTIMLWSVGSRKPLSVVHNSHGTGSWITSLGCIRRSDVFFSGSDTGSIKLWKIQGNFSNHKDIQDTNKHKGSTEIFPIDHQAIPIAGVVNQITTSADGSFLYAAVGKEHSLGRWKHIKEAKNGLLVTKINCEMDEMNCNTSA
ncbi:U3 small nucleolar RNA-interacting protein 2-like [Hylaeus volcanicus]|uniref:U3 small nucleolar RNA-interacting protein 2-like n=1 Tax=Hylaeus volcanicus TaxID=313075 RepID=UPI0023B879F3|nr:U3 small nucleolar RNA-interacting protein 2-like [Hylaeus volcanicus]